MKDNVSNYVNLLLSKKVKIYWLVYKVLKYKIEAYEKLVVKYILCKLHFVIHILIYVQLNTNDISKYNKMHTLFENKSAEICNNLKISDINIWIRSQFIS